MQFPIGRSERFKRRLKWSIAGCMRAMEKEYEETSKGGKGKDLLVGRKGKWVN